MCPWVRFYANICIVLITSNNLAGDDLRDDAGGKKLSQIKVEELYFDSSTVLYLFSSQ